MRIHRKLRERSGETLVEVLIALLIIALSSFLLAVMVSTAGNIDMTTRNRDREFYEELTHADTRTVEEGGAPKDGNVVIAVDGEADPIEVEVNVYGGVGLASYAKKT